MSPRVPCWACGGPTAPSGYLAPLPFIECSDCGLTFRPRVVSDDVREIYEDPQGYQADRGDEQWGEGFAERRRDARVRLRYLRHFRSVEPGALFDVGAAGGAFLTEAREAGWRVAGVEPMPGAAAFARQHGLDMMTGIAEDVDVAPGSFDVVTMWHVLEHIAEPLAVVERLGSWLRPGGLLALEVPNAGNAMARRLGADWPSAEPDVHLSQFTASAISRLLERAGFAVVDVSTTSILPYYQWKHRVAPRTLVHAARGAWMTRGLRQRHPTGHELLRAVAQRR